MIQRPKGTEDILPFDVYKWQYVEKTLAELAARYGFNEMRFPVFEYTELFARSDGESSDIVGKEMYTFNDRGGRSITLRPEGTAGAVRAAIQNGLLSGNFPLPQKIWYNITAYRYENVQKGRLREFHQFGAEVFGSESPYADAELISFASQIFKNLGLRDINLEINSIGCSKCRDNYAEALREYFGQFDELCDTCKTRLKINPMRILDCKSPVCKKIAEDAPIILDYICDECKNHFDDLKSILGLLGVDYTVNPRIVRGLDYYTKTVFEFIANGVGTQGTVLGGGRYDGLVEEIGGKHTPALGFAMGIERLLLAMTEQGISVSQSGGTEYYIGDTGGKKEHEMAMLTASILRVNHCTVQTNVTEKSVKAQMKYADKIGAKFAGIIGESELASGQIKLKNMKTGEEVIKNFKGTDFKWLIQWVK
ncbi:MAG: histidine--tRNA ligase [Ruminococcus sp.]|jgi:histidyl-tRNA synthetase|nr:histidine--tRNA ligase [Ruminococcus sp.]